MITCIKIQQEMNCEYICGQIQKAILTYQKYSPDLTGALLIIDIKIPSVENTNMIQKLEYKNLDT